MPRIAGRQHKALPPGVFAQQPLRIGGVRTPAERLVDERSSREPRYGLGYEPFDILERLGRNGVGGVRGVAPRYADTHWLSEWEWGRSRVMGVAGKLVAKLEQAGGAWLHEEAVLVVVHGRDPLELLCFLGGELNMGVYPGLMSASTGFSDVLPCSHTVLGDQGVPATMHRQQRRRGLPAILYRLQP